MEHSTSLSESDRRWLDIISQCRASGKSDYQWLKENSICPPTFYYHIKQLRKKTCEIPGHTPVTAKPQIQEVVQLVLDETESSAPMPDQTDDCCNEAVRICIQGIQVSITNQATQETIRNTLSALRSIC